MKDFFLALHTTFREMLSKVSIWKNFILDHPHSDEVILSRGCFIVAIVKFCCSAFSKLWKWNSFARDSDSEWSWCGFLAAFSTRCSSAHCLMHPFVRNIFIIILTKILIIVIVIMLCPNYFTHFPKIKIFIIWRMHPTVPYWQSSLCSFSFADSFVKVYIYLIWVTAPEVPRCMTAVIRMYTMVKRLHKCLVSSGNTQAWKNSWQP